VINCFDLWRWKLLNLIKKYFATSYWSYFFPSEVHCNAIVFSSFEQFYTIYQHLPLPKKVVAEICAVSELFVKSVIWSHDGNSWRFYKWSSWQNALWFYIEHFHSLKMQDRRGQFEKLLQLPSPEYEYPK